MDRDSIQRSEWQNPANWKGPRWLSFYASKRDPRIWVPKQIPMLGWTLNLAHAGGWIWLAGIWLSISILAAVITVVVLAYR